MDQRLGLIRCRRQQVGSDAALVVKRDVAGVREQLRKHDPQIVLTQVGPFRQDPAGQIEHGAAHGTVIEIGVIDRDGRRAHGAFQRLEQNGLAVTGGSGQAFAELRHRRAADTPEYVGRPDGIVHDTGALQFNQGGYILGDYFNWLDAYSLKVRGIKATSVGPCNNYDFKSAWLAH